MGPTRISLITVICLTWCSPNTTGTSVLTDETVTRLELAISAVFNFASAKYVKAMSFAELTQIV